MCVSEKKNVSFLRKKSCTAKWMISQENDSWSWPMQRMYDSLLETLIVQESSSLGYHFFAKCFYAIIQSHTILQ